MVKNIPQNVALEKTSQSAFSKAIHTIKSRVKKGELEVPTTAKIRKGPSRGVVYLSHIPHGFYENEMEKYFTQFGNVTRLKLARSKKTGRSKGYAFIEFENNEVAQIAAETMNNYLMFTKLVKAKYLAPEEVSEAVFYGRKITPANCPGVAAHNLQRKLSNRRLNAAQVAKKKIKARKRVASMQDKLNQMGINYTIQLGGKGAENLTLPTSADTKVTPEEEIKPSPKLSRKSSTPIASKSPKLRKLSLELEMEDKSIDETPKTPDLKHTPKSKKTPQIAAATDKFPSAKKMTPINTPVSKKQSPEKPLSAKKTPISAKKTPLSAKKTPLSAKKSNTPKLETPVSKQQTPEKLMSPKNTPISAKKSKTPKLETPLSKKQTPEKPLSAKKTPMSGKKSQTPKIQTPLQTTETEKTPKTASGTPKQKNLTPKPESAKKITETEVPEKVKKGRKSVLNLKTPSPRRTRSGKILAGKSPLKLVKEGELNEDAVTPAKRATRKSIAVMKVNSPATPKVPKRYSLTPAPRPARKSRVM